MVIIMYQELLQKLQINYAYSRPISIYARAASPILVIILKSLTRSR